jgi:hypothetical protein
LRKARIDAFSYTTCIVTVYTFTFRSRRISVGCRVSVLSCAYARKSEFTPLFLSLVPAINASSSFVEVAALCLAGATFATAWCHCEIQTYCPFNEKSDKKFKTPKLVNIAVQINFPPILGAQIRILPVTAPCNSMNKNLWLNSTRYNISDPIVYCYLPTNVL